MKLTLENIGKIKHAEIDLSKDLIVLCGPNNTGKTYVAYSVYGLCSIRHGAGTIGPGPFVRLSEGVNSLDSLSEINLKEVFFNSQSWILQFIAWQFKVEIPYVFGVSESVFSDTNLIPNLDFDEVWQQVYKSSFLERIRYQGLLTIEKSENSDSLSVIHSQSSEISNGKVAVFETLVNNAIKRLFLRAIFPKSHIEPTERIAVNLFWKEILVKRTFSEDEPIEVTEDKIDNMRPFSMPIRESLQQAARISEIRLNSSEFSYLADAIEIEILQGKLSLNADNDIVFSIESASRSIGIHEAGSSVKALASIVFYLRHQAQRGDLYIIDEPELTLHPDNQRKMARILARMMNAGIKIMMSTHSDYIIRELNNLMMLNVEGQDEQVAKLMDEYGYKKEELIDFNRVGAYLFTEDVMPIEVSETGFEVRTIDDEINSLNNASAEIYFKLHD